MHTSKKNDKESEAVLTGSASLAERQEEGAGIESIPSSIPALFPCYEWQGEHGYPDVARTLLKK